MSEIIFVERVPNGFWKRYDADENIPVPRVGDHIKFHEPESVVPPWFLVKKVGWEHYSIPGVPHVLVYLEKSEFTTDSEEEKEE